MRKERISFYDQIQKNKLKSFFTLLLSVLFTIFFIYVVGLALKIDIFILSIFAIIFSLLMNLGAYYNSHRIALASVKAYEADPKKYRHLHNMVEGLAIAAGIPKPKVYIMPSPEINAFASGRDPKHAVVCVTEGALKHLNDSELEGVLAHEISHIMNYDIRYVTILTIIVGLVSIISEIFLRSLFYGGRDDRKNIGLIFLAILLAIIAPIIVRLIYFALSRQREYLADATAVKLTRNPKGLINALLKIKEFYSVEKKTKAVAAMSPMYFASPHEIIRNAFRTHPPIEKRIEVLKKM